MLLGDFREPNLELIALDEQLLGREALLRLPARRARPGTHGVLTSRRRECRGLPCCVVHRRGLRCESALAELSGGCAPRCALCVDCLNHGYSRVLAGTPGR